MTTFFRIFVTLCGAVYAAALLSGHFGPSLGMTVSGHLLLGLSAAILCICAHCLIFAIFTGSGKDTRLLVEDLGLDKELVKRSKRVKMVVFPPALYACLFVVVAAAFGGFLSTKGATWGLNYLHPIVGWLCFAYQIKVFIQEARAVKDNAKALDEVNALAAAAVAQSGHRQSGSEDIPVDLGAVETHDWGTHVYALGSFLAFLGYNVWLPYFYLKVVMGLVSLPFWPFGLSCAILLGGGWYLKWKYREFRPQSPKPVQSVTASS